MSDTKRLDTLAVELLLRGIEARRPLFSAAVLQRYPSEMACLMGAALIAPSGHEAATSLSDQSDRLVTAHWSSDGPGYGYFSEPQGWAWVESELTRTFSIDVTAFIAEISAGFDLSPRHRCPLELVEGQLWEIGAARFGSWPVRIPLLFGRRLHLQRNYEAVERALTARPSEQQRVLLTSTAAPTLPKAPARCHVLSVPQLLKPGLGLAIDPDLVCSRLFETPAIEPERELTVLSDGREVRFRGRTYIFTGLTQRRIVCLLYQHYLAGKRWVSSTELLEELDLHSTKRVRDIFNKSPAWGHLLTEKQGLTGFCFD